MQEQTRKPPIPMQMKPLSEHTLLPWGIGLSLCSPTFTLSVTNLFAIVAKEVECRMTHSSHFVMAALVHRRLEKNT